jgi:hypothetical protein
MKPLAAATALKKLTYTNMLPYGVCVLHPPKDVQLEHLTLEEPYPPGRYDFNADLVHCMMHTKHVSIQVLDLDLGCVWQKAVSADEISALQGPSMVEWFEWTIPNYPDDDEDGPWEISGSAKGERAFTEGWNDMLRHLRNL